MRRLLRILLNTATVLSLVLCAATMAAWVRSYLARDFVSWSLANPRLRLHIGTYRGGLAAGITSPVGRDTLPPPGVGWKRFAPLSYAQAVGPPLTFLNGFGFDTYYFENSAFAMQNKFALRQFACPYWFIMLVTAIVPVARLPGWRRRRARRLRMRLGLCQHCGYDCRATPDRCPECGMAGVTPPPISA